MALSASTALPSAASDALSLGEADLLFVYILRKAAELPNAEQFGKVIGSGVLLGAAECVERLAAAPQAAVASETGLLCERGPEGPRFNF